MRRPTAIALVVLFLVVIAAAILQLTQDPPDAPFPGPVQGTPLPSGLTTVAPSGA